MFDKILLEIIRSFKWMLSALSVSRVTHYQKSMLSNDSLLPLNWLVKQASKIPLISILLCSIITFKPLYEFSRYRNDCSFSDTLWHRKRKPPLKNESSWCRSSIITDYPYFVAIDALLFPWISINHCEFFFLIRILN